jgi:Concanavalin A-like lectin/glucanases superfamily
MGTLARRLIPLAATAIALGAPAGAAAASGPVALWRLDDRGQVAVDATGHGLDGTLGDSAGPDSADPAPVDGHDGRGAMDFDGGDSIAIPDVAALEPQQLTVEAWVRRLGSPGSWRYVLAKGAIDCDRSSYGLYTGAGRGIAFYVSDAARYWLSPAATPQAVWDGSWHHVAGTYDGRALRLFVDGREVGASTPAPAAIAYGSASKGVWIGTYRGSCDLPFSGDLDDVAVWDRPLNPLDVAAAAGPTAGAGGSGGPAGTSGGAPGAYGSPGFPARRACYAVRLNRRTLALRKRTKVTVTVRDRGRPVYRAAVLARGAGVRALRRTTKHGRARLVLRARKRARVKVRVRGQSARCPAPSLRPR